MTCPDQNVEPRVLVADDEKVITDTLVLILNRNGFQSVGVYSGTAAVQKVHGWKPDILLCDVFMPGFSGIDVAIQVRALYPTCRVFLLSGQAEVEDLLRDAREHGHYFDLLVKPVHPADLLTLLRNHTPSS